VVHDADLVVVGWNDAAERCFGFSAQEVLGRSLTAFLINTKAEATWRAGLATWREPATLECARQTGGNQRCTWTFQPIAGESTRWLCAAQPLLGPSLPERILGAVLDNLPISIWAVDRQGDYVFHDGLGIAQLGIERGSYVGQNMWEMWKGNEGTVETLAQVRSAFESNQPAHVFAEAMGMAWETWCVPLTNPGDDQDDRVELVVSTTMDISAHRQVEAELRERIAQIEQQRELIEDLATPIIEVWHGVLTLPLVGVIDKDRTALMTERLLDEITRVRARFTIVDLTGVEDVDTQTAAYLVSLVRAIRLLGAEAIITGIRPSVARTFVSLGVDLSTIQMRSNLRSGLEYCMQKVPAVR
jgi:rsbT co-antagonist protein RsbR